MALVHGGGGAKPVVVNKRSQDFQRVHYMLEMALIHADVKITHIQMWDIGSPAQVAKFEGVSKKMRGQPALDTWIDMEGMDSINSEENVFRRGFSMPINGSGMSFTTGNVRVSLPPRSGSPGGLNRFVLGQLFAGRAYPTDIRSEQSKANKFSVPIGYDSLYMYDPETLENDSGSNSYHHEYRVFNAAQVLPRYLVHFEVAALTEADRERNALAKEAHHSLNGADVMGDILQLLDKKLHWSQESVRQKLNGVAALQTELTRHADEYDHSLSQSKRTDPSLEGCKSQIKQQLQLLNAKLLEVKRNSQEVEETVYQILQDALFRLQDETQAKLTMLLGEELELRRRLAHIYWAESSLATSRTELGPPDFVHAWRNHKEIRKSMYAYRDMSFSTLGMVHADINVVGGVQIVTEQGPTDAIGVAAKKEEERRLRDIPALAAEVANSASTDFRREVFKNASPSVVGPADDDDYNNGMGQAGTNSLVASFKRDLISSADLQSAGAGSTASPPKITDMGLLSSNHGSPLPAGNYIEFKGTVRGEAVASPGSLGDAWMQQLRESRGVPDPFTNSKPPPPPESSPPPLRQQEVLEVADLQDKPVKLGSSAKTKPAQLSVAVDDEGGSSARIRSPTRAGVKRFAGKHGIDTQARRMKRIYERRQNLDAAEISQSAFIGSNLIDPEKRSDIYLCVPNAADMQTELIFSSAESNGMPSVQAIQDALTNYRDNTCLLVARSGSKIFGAFAERGIPCMDEGVHGGTRRCFLFSITENLIIPYSGRMQGRRPQHTVLPMRVDEAESDAEEEMEEYVDEEMKQYYDDIYRSVGWDAVFGKPDEIRFGNGDLVLRGDLRDCRSHLEASYGFGMSTTDAKTLLAGGERFGIDDIEVWLIGDSSELGGGYSDYQQQGGTSQYGGNYDYEDKANVGNATPGTMPAPPVTDVDMGDWRPPEPPQQR